MKKRICALALTICLSLAFAACSANGANAPGEQAQLGGFKVGYLASTGHILYFIAEDKGYFEEEGLQVELLLFNNSGEGINALQQRKIDAGAFGTAPPLTFISQGYDIAIIGGQMSQGHAMVAKAENAEEYADLTRLAGKKVASIRLNTGDVVFRKAFLDAGLTVGTDEGCDVQIIELTSAADVIEAVKNGAVDAGLVWTPYRKTAEQQGLKIVKYSSEIPGCENVPCCRQLVNSTLLDADSAKYTAFLRALIRAYAFYRTEKNESIDILYNYVKVDKEILCEETYGKYISSNPDPSKDAVVAFFGYMNDIGYLDSDLDIAAYIHTEFYKAALDELLEREPENEVYRQLESEFEQNNH